MPAPTKVFAMKEKIAAFFLNHCFKIMIAGFAISAVGVVMYIQAQHGNVVLRKISFSLTVTGLALYIIGRIGVIVGQRRSRKLRRETLKDVEERINE
jgi:hypothetical protein